jgi:hypothetical protein
MALRAFRFLTFEEYKKLTRAERNRYVAGVTEELMRGGATGYGLRVTGYGLHGIIETRGAVTTFAHDVTKFAQRVTQLTERAESLHRAMLRVSAQHSRPS